MHRILLFLVLFHIVSGLKAQLDSIHLLEIQLFQKEMNHHYADKETSPLEKKDRRRFKKLPFFPINDTLKIIAKFIRTPNEPNFEMITTTDRRPIYKKYGEAHFELYGAERVLSIYQNQTLIEQEEYKNHLFLPFTDLTNGHDSYGGGRFIDLTIPESDSIVIDFNKAYNPYCCYNHKYSCPIPPKENFLQAKINAGVMAPKQSH